MANEEHLALLKQGLGTWNEWREKNPEIRPDRRGADLSGASLTVTLFTGAILTRAVGSLFVISY